MRENLTPLLDAALQKLPPDALILDAGGWFKPFARATHVADLLPYETRGAALTLQPLPHERFSRESWLQIDFLDPCLHFPFPDGFFHFAVCSHTVEDLADPAPLLRELRRTSRAGYFEAPSRLSEQTVGQRDRMCGRQGHPHHHWIVECDGTTTLHFFSKAESLEGNSATRVPLRRAEQLVRTGAQPAVCTLSWTKHFEFTFTGGEAARRRATDFVQELALSPFDRWLDRALRGARRLKHGWGRDDEQATRQWWDEMLALSRPFSRLPLP